MAAAKPRLSDGLSVVDIDGEAVVYDSRDGQFHYLNHSAALLLDLCDGTATVRQMAEAIADVYEMTTDEVERQLRPVVRDLRKLRVLEPSRKAASVDGSAEAALDAASSETTADDADQRRIVRMEVPRST